MPNLANKRANLRYKKVLDVGLELFLEKGYSDTSLSDIVEKSGGSLSTIYKYFKNKEGLFKASVLNSVDEFNKKLEINSKLDANLSMEEFLYKFGLSYFQGVLSKKSIAFFKLVLSECFNKNTVKIGKDFMNGIDGFMSNHLVKFFKQQDDMRKFSDEELLNFAKFFTYLVREPYFTNAMFQNSEIKLDKKIIDTHIKNIINIFLYGILK